MNRMLLQLMAIVAMSSMIVAGGTKGKNTVAATSDIVEIPADEKPIIPIIPIVGDSDPCHIYIGTGIIYNRVYSTDSGWFDNSVLTQDETGGFVGLIGCQVNKYLAVEARWTETYWDQDYSDARTYGIYLKPMYPVTESITVYGLLGYGNTYVKGSKGDPDNDYSAWEEDIGRTMMDHNGVHWGFGAMYDITENFSLFGEFTSVADDESIEPTKLYCYDDTNSHTGTGCVGDTNLYDKLSVDGLTLGLIYKF